MFYTIKFEVQGNHLLIGDSAIEYELIHYGNSLYAYTNLFTIAQNTSDFSLYSILEDSNDTGYLYSDGNFVSSVNNMWAPSTKTPGEFARFGHFYSSGGIIVDYKLTEFIIINSSISREDT